MSTSQVSFGLLEGDSNAARPSSNSFEISPSEDGMKLDRCDPIMIIRLRWPSLVIKLPSNVGQEFKVNRDGVGEDEEEGGFKTPTSTGSKIILNSKRPPSVGESCLICRARFNLPLSTNFGRKINQRPKERDIVGICFDKQEYVNR
ncbi:hypothetical protein ACJRO7_002906 [Eucalyptus globulus]|uniref:Uncharacterized protein n=1 Tax=Eucalyptus globulus TaxID=34317 RepID=A0ABD3LVZ0_EUCGL